MKRSNVVVTLSLLFVASTAAQADSLVTDLCGPDHVNEADSEVDIRPNPVGFYVSSLGEQINNHDPRIIQASGDAFYLCTRSAATPDMDTSKALLLMQERRVKYLFVPLIWRFPGASS